MSFKVKIDKADQAFSLYVRLRDSKCVRCGKPGSPDAQGRPIIGLQCSHYFGRGREATRFDSENCDSLDFGCHRFWETQDREGYRNFKVNQLGQDGFDRLTLRANTYQKKDRKMSLIVAKALLDELTSSL